MSRRNPRRRAQRRAASQDTGRVIVTISGGVADVAVKTAGVQLLIIDYDVEGEDAHGLDRDVDGRPCCIARWEAAESVGGREHQQTVRRKPRRKSRQARR